MKHRLSAMALALSMGLSAVSPIMANDFESNEFDDVTETIKTVHKMVKTEAGDIPGSSNSKTEEEIEELAEKLFPIAIFTEPNFRNYLVYKFITSPTDPIDNISEITELNLEILPENEDQESDTQVNEVEKQLLSKIVSLDGIFSLENLNTLSCKGLPALKTVNNCTGLAYLKSVDIERNPNLISIIINDCSDPSDSNDDPSIIEDQKLTATIKDNQDLSFVELCGDRNLEKLELNNCPSLSTLRVYETNLDKLDLSNITTLTTLECQNTKFTSLDVKNNSSLEKLICSSTQLTDLDLSDLKHLTSVECKNNEKLKTLTLKGCTRLNSVDCREGNINLNKIDIRECPNLDKSKFNYPGKDLTLVEDPDEPDYDYSVRGVADSYWQTDGTVQPKPVLKYGTYTLKEGKDYILSYKTDASGTKGTMTIKGKGIFAGVNKTVHYKIKPAETMKRLYNPNSGEHFYTSSDYERSSLVRLGWRDENIGWTSPKTSNSPVYRLYNPNAGDHHYTKNASEKDMLVSRGWRYEGIAFYSSDDQKNGVPIYRQYNPNAKSGAHNYTSNRAEHDRLVRLGWHDEGIAWYGVDTTK